MSMSMPSSFMVGTSGRSGERVEVVTASARSLPSLTRLTMPGGVKVAHADGAAHQRDRAFAGALVGDRDAGRAGPQLEQLGRQREARRGGGIVRFVRVGLGPGGELRRGLGRMVGRHQQDQRHLDCDGERYEARQRRIAGLVNERADGQLAAAADQQRVAVGRLLGDIFDREPRAAAGLVLDHHRLAEPLGELIADDARHHVGAAAGRIADDDAG